MRNKVCGTRKGGSALRVAPRIHFRPLCANAHSARKRLDGIDECVIPRVGGPHPQTGALSFPVANASGQRALGRKNHKRAPWRFKGDRHSSLQGHQIARGGRRKVCQVTSPSKTFCRQSRAMERCVSVPALRLNDTLPPFCLRIKGAWLTTAGALLERNTNS
jgi:hypothetical protein